MTDDDAEWIVEWPAEWEDVEWTEEDIQEFIDKFVDGNNVLGVERASATSQDKARTMEL